MGGRSKEFEHGILDQGWEDGFQDRHAAWLKSKADALGRSPCVWMLQQCWAGAEAGKEVSTTGGDKWDVIIPHMGNCLQSVLSVQLKAWESSAERQQLWQR